MSRRSEREIAADTVFALIVEGLLPPTVQVAARAATGLTHDDLQKARARHRQRGFTPPKQRERLTATPGMRSVL